MGIQVEGFDEHFTAVWRQAPEASERYQSQVTHWICPNGHPGRWNNDPCRECDLKYTRAAYTGLKCPWCVGTHGGWYTARDGYTRMCCSSFLSPLPMPYLTERLSALMLDEVFASIEALFRGIVPCMGKKIAVNEAKRLPLARLMSARAHVSLANQLLSELVLSMETEAQLALAVRALRQIASREAVDDWSRGLARGALRRLGLEGPGLGTGPGISAGLIGLAAPDPPHKVPRGTLWEDIELDGRTVKKRVKPTNRSRKRGPRG